MIKEIGKKKTNNLKDIDCFLFDMDGTIYLGSEIIDGAAELIAEIKAQHKRAVYITNNSARTAIQYVNKLAGMGIHSEEKDFFTSADALVHFLDKMNAGRRLFVLGTPDFESFLKQHGYIIIKEYTAIDNGRPDFVILGYDTTVTYDKLRIACDYLTDGVRYIATHPDMVCPAEGGRSVPDAGAFMLLIEGATGRRPELIAGKPDPCMINAVSEITGCPKSRMAVVGDRLNTDILSGINADVTTICVLTGETTAKMLETSEIKPDYVFVSVKELLQELLTEYTKN